MKYSIALDIGATKILGGIIVRNKVVYKIKKPTQSKAGKVKVLKNIISIVNELVDYEKKKRNKLQKIGIGIAGQVDYEKGIVLSTANFGKDFKNIKLVDILNKEFKVSVSLENDVKCFLQGEMKHGIGRNMRDVIGLTFGTGIGGAIVTNGQMWRGKDNTAGEVGHMRITGQWIGQPSKCGCGQKYCWETVASGKAWHKLYKKYNKKKADEIVVANIVTGLMNLSYAFNPQVFILGGGLTEHKDLLSKIRKEFNKQAIWPWFKKIRIVRAKMEDDAILLGAIL
ncbi:ROK family protein [Patescibacteria group bacterium]